MITILRVKRTHNGEKAYRLSKMFVNSKSWIVRGFGTDLAIINDFMTVSRDNKERIFIRKRLYNSEGFSRN